MCDAVTERNGMSLVEQRRCPLCMCSVQIHDIVQLCTCSLQDCVFDHFNSAEIVSAAGFQNDRQRFFFNRLRKMLD